MELSLKIELSDEQYNLLMHNSYDEIFKNPETQDQLRQIIVDNFAEYFSGIRNKDSKSYIATSYRGICNFVEKALLKEVPKDRLSYNSVTQYEPTEFMRQLISEATEDQRKEFEDKIRKVVSELLNDSTVVTSILKEVLLNSIVNGITLGSSMMVEEKKFDKQNQDIINSAVRNLMNFSN